MNKYESFKPIDGKIKKSNESLFKRIFSAFNKPERSLSPVSNRNSPTQDILRHQSFTCMRDPASDNDLPFDETITFSKLFKTIKSNVSTTLTGSSDNLSTKQKKLNRVFWMPDSICHKCFYCEDEFTAIRRRHHCRMCGQIFCYRCCAFELPGSLWNQSQPQRSCHRCFQSYHSSRSQRKIHQLSQLNISNQDSSSLYKENPSNNSSTFSLASDTSHYQESKNNVSNPLNKNISFSSSDLNSDKLYNIPEKKSYQIQDFGTLKRNHSVPEFEIDKGEPMDVIHDTKISPTKLTPKVFIQNHFLNIEKPSFLKAITTRKFSSNQKTSLEPQYSQKVLKEILIFVWKQIIVETERLRNDYFNKVKVQTETRSLANQFSFPHDDDTEDSDGLGIIFMNATNPKSCINGNSLVSWIFNKIEEVKEKSHAIAICQSYLDMQLIFPFFIQEGHIPFKDDNLLYVIRECTSDYSPRTVNKDNESNHFTDCELMGYLSSSSLQKSCGNSTFYKDDNLQSVDSQVADPSIAPTSLSAFTNIYANQKFDGSNDTSYQKYTINLWNKSCDYLEKLLKQELRDYNLNISWCNIILPICKMICETVSPNISDVKWTNDIRNYVQIKKIPDSKVRDCQMIYSVSISKNVDFSMFKDMKNPSVILIKASIDYWRHKKLVSLDPLILQEEEYLKNCVKKIVNLKPDFVVVEGNVSLIAKELLEISGLVLVSNVRKVQMERLARMLGTTILDSVDTLGSNADTQLGRCSQISVERFTLMNGRHKHLLFFKLFNNKDGCTLLLRSSSLSELVRMKYITQFMIVAFRNAYLELACLKNFQIRFLGYKSNVPGNDSNVSKNENANSANAFLEIIESRMIAMSPNVYYPPPVGVVRSLYNPEQQNHLLSLDILNISWKEKLHDVLKRKQRHICAEQYSIKRMQTKKHPLIQEPVIHAFLNCYNDRGLSNNEKCVIYSDFRNNGSRFMNVNESVERSLFSTLNFDSSDIVLNGGFFTRDQQERFREQEKKKFDSIMETFNPRNFCRILLLYSIQTPVGICEKPRKISLGYYETSDKTLGNFVSSMLNDTSSCPLKCESSLCDHVYKFVHNGGCIEVSVHQMESDSHRKLLNTVCTADNESVSNIKIWNWCSRCDKTLGLRNISEETWNISLGRFFDLMFNMNMLELNLVPGQCSHSLQNDVHFYFTQNTSTRALEIKYVPVLVYEIQTPDLFINIVNNKSREDLFKSFKILKNDIGKVREVKTKFNLEIKAKIMKLKDESKVENSELWNFLQQDSNSDQYSETMENMSNVMEDIYDVASNTFNVDKFIKHEHIISEEIIKLWVDVVNFVTKWDQKLNEALEKEEKDKKQLEKDDKDKDKKPFKLESKANKSSYEDLLEETDVAISKSCINPILVDMGGITDTKMISLNKALSCYSDSQDSVEMKKKYLWNSCEDKNMTVPHLQLRFESRPSSRASTVDNVDNGGEHDYLMSKREKIITARESDSKQPSHGERLTGSTASILTRKLFPSLFSNNNLKVLDEPIPTDCNYVFPDIWSVKEPAVVKDDSITSVIAFALSSNVYHDKLHEMVQFTTLRPNTKSDSFLTVYPSQESKLPSALGQIDGFNNLSSVIVETTGFNKERCSATLTDGNSKDREICVRYLNRPEIDDQNDFLEMRNCNSKTENEEIKIEVYNDDPNSEDVFMKPSINTKLPINAPKKFPKCDFEISFSNHKVKCFCRIYNALQFHKLREEILGSNQHSYIRSLSHCKHWVTTGGKSGLKFRKSMDDRYIIKQLHPMELNGFKKFHEKYFEYIMDRIEKKEKCVLAKILGIYHVDYSNSLTKVNEKLDFLVMENLFYNQKPSKIFDLKGNKQIAVNVTAEKMVASDTSVMQDKDFINYSRTKPIYVSWQTQIALKETLIRDTDFLKGLPVMDYSLLVGVDDDEQVLVIGIIDYLRMFTIDKLIEMHFKQKLLTPTGELPTVIQPQRYQKRFLEAMEEYLLICPIPWDCLLLHPSPYNINNNCNNNVIKNSSMNSSTINRTSERIKDENILRSGLFEFI